MCIRDSHITRPGYDVELLKKCIVRIKDTYGLEIYLEPGEAVALNGGSLLTKVEDIVENEGDIAILDASAACHMPDVLEMPYRPPLKDAGDPGDSAARKEKPYVYPVSYTHLDVYKRQVWKSGASPASKAR